MHDHNIEPRTLSEAVLTADERVIRQLTEELRSANLRARRWERAYRDLSAIVRLFTKTAGEIERENAR